MARTVQALLFDLGGVVVDIAFERALAHWAPHSRLPPEQLARPFEMDAAYERHETGQLAAPAYFAHLRERLALACDDAQLQAGWNAIFIAPVAPTLAMVDAVRGRVPCYAISNTNAVHLAHMRSAFPGMLERFEKVFASHQIGARKPQPAAFAHVLRDIGVAAPAALFFDDTAANVEAARACGLQAVLVRGPDDVRGALAAAGLLPQGP